MRKLTLFHCALLLFSHLSFGEDSQAKRGMAILPTTDSSRYGLAEALQNALGQLYQSTGALAPQLSGFPLPGFTANDIEKGFRATNSNLMSFAYMEPKRISVFLFAQEKPGNFVVAYRLLTDPPNGKMTSDFIEKRFRESVAEVLANFREGKFQPLPGSDAGDDRVNKQKADEARRLFRELAALEDKTFYLGADIGVARFATSTSSASTVNFGAYGGARLNPKLSAELGVDAFSYALLHADLRYHLPIAEKYIDLSVTGGFGRFLGSITDNRGYASGTIPTGQMVFGPGMGFDIPLLGATLRGDIRFYLGSANVLLGSYGIIYSL